MIQRVPPTNLSESLSATSPITAENAAATTATMTPKVAVMGDGVVAPSVKEFAVKKKVFHQLQKEVGRSFVLIFLNVVV